MRYFEPVRKTMQKNTELVTQLPTRADNGSAGYDLYSKQTSPILPGQMVMFWTDVKAYMEGRDVLMLYPRSSMGSLQLMLANSVGVIDASYHNNKKNDGNIGIMLYNYGDEPVLIEVGDRIGQGVFVSFSVTDNDVTLKDSRDGGFGSTNE